MRSTHVPFPWTIVFFLCVLQGISFACARNRIKRGFFEEFGGFGGGDSSGYDGHGGNAIGGAHHGGHGGQNCEQSQCGYNIRHCPHGCEFNSLQCGNSGASYDMCCCY